MTFFNHMKETDEQHIGRVSKKVQKILWDEGLAFDVQMIPNIRIVAVPKPKTLDEKEVPVV